jgi:ornithine carbamoyltransferase
MYEYAFNKRGLEVMNLHNRDFLTLKDYTPEEINYLLELSFKFKKLKHKNKKHNYLDGKNVALIFEKDSTRTRCAFEIAARDLGMHATYLGPTGSQMGKKESIADTARVLSRMYDGIEYRGFDQSIVNDLAKYSDVPVWNGLTTQFHPTQMLADVMTAKENFGYLKGLNWVFMGDARNNVGNSLMVVCSKLGINFTCCAPKDLFPDEDLINECKEFAKVSGSKLTFTDDPLEGTKDANVIYTDVWVSMGEPMELWDKRIKLLSPFQVNKKIMENANKNAIFLHCLPSFHDTNTTIGNDVYKKYGLKELEVSNEVFESKQSKVFDEAENRLHTIKAVMYATLK